MYVACLIRFKHHWFLSIPTENIKNLFSDLFGGCSEEPVA